jgi:hypothetical protein
MRADPEVVEDGGFCNGGSLEQAFYPVEKIGDLIE